MVVIKFQKLMVDGKAAKYEITDTRMKIMLNKSLKANGGKAKVSMDFSFVSPEYGSDRMGYLPTKKRNNLYNCTMVSKNGSL